MIDMCQTDVIKVGGATFCIRGLTLLVRTCKFEFDLLLREFLSGLSDF